MAKTTFLVFSMRPLLCPDLAVSVIKVLSCQMSRENRATTGAFRASRCQVISAAAIPDMHQCTSSDTLASSLIPPRVPVLFCELRLLSTKHTKFAKGLLRYGSREKILVVVTLTLLKYNVKRFDHGGNERLRGECRPLLSVLLYSNSLTMSPQETLGWSNIYV